MNDARTGRPLLLGHRGARSRRSIPENTFKSFDQALADRCDGFEFDVRLTADGQAVICHDAQSEGVDIAAASAAECAGLPQLEDVLARYRESAFLDIELKVTGLEKATIAAIRKYAPSRGFVLSSFVGEVLRAVHTEYSEIPLGLICETRAELQHWRQLPISYVIPHYKLVDLGFIQGVKDAGKKVLVWTVNSRAEMQRLQALGVDGIISDETRLLAETLLETYPGRNASEAT